MVYPILTLTISSIKRQVLLQNLLWSLLMSRVVYLILTLTITSIKRQVLLQNLLWILLMSRVVYPILILNIKSTSLYFCYTILLNKCSCEQALFLHARPWRLAVFLQAAPKDEVLCHIRIGGTHLTPSYINILKRVLPCQ